MAKSASKLDRLRHQGLLNTEPERIRAPWFHTGDFFDVNDLLQTRYGMLRHVQIDGASKTAAAVLFGVSRPTFYQAEAAFARAGLAGLLPRQRGPKGVHKRLVSWATAAFFSQPRWSRCSENVTSPSDSIAFSLLRLSGYLETRLQPNQKIIHIGEYNRDDQQTKQS